MSAPNSSDTFLLEADELLGQIEEVLVELTPETASPDAINQLFRAFHTLKGSGAMFGFTAVADFTHHVETALDLVRSGRLPVSQPLLDAILAARDHIKALLEPPSLAGSGQDGNKIVAALEEITSAQANSQTAFQADLAAEPTSIGELRTWRIRFRPDPGLLAAGMSPLPVLNELRGIGRCEIAGHADEIPTLESLQPDRCYLWWEIALTTAKGLDAIKDVFIFVEDGSEIAIEPDDSAEAVAEEPGEGPEVAEPDSKKQTRSASTVRVPAEKLDRLVNLVGELVMNQSRLTQVSSRADVPGLAEPVEEIERLVAELRDSVLGIRMMPIGATFTRFKRLVRDLAAELGKEIDLITEGAETELDKTVLDQLADPLVHLIRNSIDHGIEAAEERIRAEKPRRGTLRLTARHTGSNVVVGIEDDGRGLDASRIRAKAVEKQLIAEDASLTEREIFNLIFLPGFSTARQITNISGRGVGMDVVKRKIEALRGSISIDSRHGQGTKIDLTLPLTLAIIDGLLVEIGGDQYIVPMSSVAENVELHRSERATKNGRNVVAVRGELVPYICLRDAFGMDAGHADVQKIVIVQHQDQRVGLVVDRVVGSHQTVIQSLGAFYGNVEFFSGATIMGDGRVALILNLMGLVRSSDKNTERQFA